ncbi:putative isoprenylcysteine alpha-carbonyl methylesterase ICME [Ananas comosus]|uniref:protein-S-isoprenylcysteine alpha-carbonyl methylesterase n=1 Tax=Ananas comosus TaxID=4615 RepID=A0A199VEQ8_ANACO|nr:putative isoprenylcysteine alpha-carbonyl methylesterase ICME [Ananas comosus]
MKAEVAVGVGGDAAEEVEGSGEEAAFLRRSPSGSLRRRAAGDGCADMRRPSFRSDVEHAAAETYLVTRLTLTLLQYLGLGSRWISKFLALGFYAILLMPGFLQVGYYYFFSSQVRRSVVYGEQPRNRLDLYLPKDSKGPSPVVAFVTGGAWIIGYKAWGALLGRRLAERGIIVACIDYRNFPQGTISDMVAFSCRNFPQGTISDMVRDASQGISFVCNNISSYGGDPNQIYLIGQSAGAHIAACSLLDQAIKEAEGEVINWSVSQIKTYFGLSGGYNMSNLVDHFHERGLYRRIFLSIMEGEQALWRFSPEIVVKEASVKAISLLPPIILFHGTDDYSIPPSASKTFADALRSAGAQAKLVLYEGKTHTDLFIQDPLRGGRDELIENIVAVIHADDPIACANDAAAPRPRRLVPEWQLQLARKVSPF